MVSATTTYVFNPKYAVSAATAYDFGTQNNLSSTVMFTRIGTDLQVSVGFTYNALLNNFGVTFNVIPNIAAANSSNAFGQAGVGGVGGNPNQDRR